MGEYIKYTEIIESIKKKIQNNIYKSNELLPSEKELCIEYGVSRRTVRRAIMDMMEDGYLYTVPGKGTFVHVLNKDNYEVNFKLKEIISGGFDHTELYEATILSPDVYHVYNLQVAPTDKVLRIQSLLKRENRIVAFDVKNIPYFLGIPLKEENLNYNSLKDILKTKISQYEMSEEIYVSSIMADDFLCKVMALEAAVPLFVFDIIIRDRDKIPLGWNKIYVLWNECEIKGVSV